MEDRRPLGWPSEVAEYLRISELTLTDWRYRGNGPTFLRVGKRVRYRWSDVERWLESQEAGGDAA